LAHIPDKGLCSPRRADGLAISRGGPSQTWMLPAHHAPCAGTWSARKSRAPCSPGGLHAVQRRPLPGLAPLLPEDPAASWYEVIASSNRPSPASATPRLFSVMPSPCRSPASRQIAMSCSYAATASTGLPLPGRPGPGADRRARWCRVAVSGHQVLRNPVRRPWRSTPCRRGTIVPTSGLSGPIYSADPNRTQGADLPRGYELAPSRQAAGA
jgi:hypothetical protein